jgi:hypothetical protein
MLLTGRCPQEEQREKTLSAVGVQRVLFVELMHPSDGACPEAGVRVCAERISRRGEHHHTLYPGVLMWRVLESFAASWEPIEDRSVVLRVDMTQEPADALRSLLEAIAATVPELGAGQRAAAVLADSAALAHSVSASHAVESGLSSKHKVQFWGIDVGELGDFRLPPAARAALAGGKLRTQDRCHVTCVYLARDDEAVAAAAAAVQPLAGQRVVVRVRAVGWDSQAMALEVEHDVPRLGTRRPHITLALAAGVAASYSNEMLSGPHERMELECELEGVVMPFFPKYA